MTYFGTSDLPALLAGFGVPVVWGAGPGTPTGKGLVDEADEEMLNAAGVNFTGRETAVTIETERFAGLKENDTITVDGQTRTVLSVHRFGDGALSRVLVRP